MVVDASVDLIREVWRLCRGDRVLTAGLYRHPRGTELRIAFSPVRGAGDVLHTRVERHNVAALELDAEGMRYRLFDSGWRDCTLPA